MIKIVSMMYLLILIYLVVFNADKSIKVIGSIGSNVTSLTKALQGRG
jgi:hypothetical protein